MFRLDSSNPAFLRIHASERLSAGDYDALEAELKRTVPRLARDKRVALLLDLRGWTGWTAAGFLRDLKFDWIHRNSFSRIAVVGDQRWHHWLTLAAKPLFSGPMRYFGEAEEKAVEWVRTS